MVFPLKTPESHRSNVVRQGRGGRQGRYRTSVAVQEIPFDALLLVSFGGPEGPDDVMPFLRNVTRGRDVPDSRLSTVADHYYHFGGVSPINSQNRELLTAIQKALAEHGPDIPVYWGNRNWAPYLDDTVRQLRDDGMRRVAAFVTAAYSSYSACGQYLDDIAAAREQVGPGAPQIVKLGHYYDHPGFVDPHADAVGAALRQLAPADVQKTRLIFTAHSIPMVMNAASGRGGEYAQQLRATATRVATAAAPHLKWDLVWQSRSGSPLVPWLEPDINDHLRQLAGIGVNDVVVSPIGFVSDHLEVRWDLDEEAAATARELGMRFARASTPGTDSRFVAMVRDLLARARTESEDSVAVSESGCCHGACCGRSVRNH